MKFCKKPSEENCALDPRRSFYGAVHVYNVRLERKSIGDVLDTNAPGEYRLEAAGPERRISVAVRRVEEHSVAPRRIVAMISAGVSRTNTPTSTGFFSTQRRRDAEESIASWRCLRHEHIDLAFSGVTKRGDDGSKMKPR